MKTKTPLSEQINRAMARINENLADHRRWKKLLRKCAEVGRSAPRTTKTDPSMTTAVDNSARQCARPHRNTKGII